MGIPADITFLVGRRYATKSGQRCILRKLGNGALRVDWRSPTREKQADRDEVNAWIASLLRAQGIEPDMKVCEDESKEAEMYAAWKQELEGE